VHLQVLYPFQFVHQLILEDLSEIPWILDLQMTAQRNFALEGAICQMAVNFCSDTAEIARCGDRIDADIVISVDSAYCV